MKKRSQRFRGYSAKDSAPTLSEADDRRLSLNQWHKERAGYKRLCKQLSKQNAAFGLLLKLEHLLHHDGTDDQFAYKAVSTQRKAARLLLTDARKVAAETPALAVFTLKILDWLRPFWPYAESRDGVAITFQGCAEGPRRENLERFVSALLESVKRQDCASRIRDAVEYSIQKGWLKRRLLPGLEISTQGHDVIAPRGIRRLRTKASWRQQELAPMLVTMAEVLESAPGRCMRSKDLQIAMATREKIEDFREMRHPASILDDNRRTHGSWIDAWIQRRRGVICLRTKPLSRLIPHRKKTVRTP
ncbi:MAG TPA: hypothetical protein VEK08_08215 [Planctomycetota bacterium]|nr:hypothetical protein [Planctomycetota bacterium]